MWTSTLDLDPKRVLITQFLGHFWHNACFASFAPLQVQNIPRQQLPATTWVRIRNRLAGISGSDLHLIQGDRDFRVAPTALPQQMLSYPGHEVVGEVLEIGDDVHHLHVGDRVVLQYAPNCLSTGVQPLCPFCAAGNYNLCEQGKLPGPLPIGGGWSEEMLLHEQQLFRIPAEMSDDQAVLLEPTAVALHAVLRCLPQQGNRVLIIGSGTLGLLMLQIVRALAPLAEVSVLARHPFQIEQATRLGATHIIYPQDSYTAIQRATNAQLYKGILGNQMLLGGYDVIYDTVGSRKTLLHALRWARAHSTVILAGLRLHMMHIDLTPIWHQEINLLGTWNHSIETWPIGTHEQHSTFEAAANLIQQHSLQPEQLITHRFPLNNYQAALITAASKASSRAIKVVFDYSLQPASIVPTIRASSMPATPAISTIRQQYSGSDVSTIQDDEEAAPYPAEPLLSPTPIVPMPIILSSQRAQKNNDDPELGAMEDTIRTPAIGKTPRVTQTYPEAPHHNSTEDTSPAHSTTESDDAHPILATPLLPATPATHDTSADTTITISTIVSPEIPEYLEPSDTPEILEYIEAPEAPEIPAPSDTLDTLDTSESLESSEHLEAPEIAEDPEIHQSLEIHPPFEISKDPEPLESSESPTIAESPEIPENLEIAESPEISEDPESSESPTIAESLEEPYTHLPTQHTINEKAIDEPFRYPSAIYEPLVYEPIIDEYTAIEYAVDEPLVDDYTADPLLSDEQLPDNVQPDAPVADYDKEEATTEVDATKHTENALQPTEKMVPVQAPRPRTRKKSNRSGASGSK